VEATRGGILSAFSLAWTELAMKTTLILTFLAGIVLLLVGAVLWTMMPEGLGTWETVLIFSVDLLGIVWFVALVALAVTSLLRRSAAGREALSGNGPYE